MPISSKYLTGLVVASMLAAFIPAYGNAAYAKVNLAFKPVYGDISVSACSIGSTPSKIHPKMKDICDSQISWTTVNATSAYIVITGGSPYLKSIYPYGYTTPGGTGLNKTNVPFWTPAGTYTVALYVNGTYPTQKKAGTGTRVSEQTITVSPQAYNSPLLESVYVAKNGVETIQQPKGWYGISRTSDNSTFFGMSATQVLFHSDDYDLAEMKVSRLTNVPSKWAWGTEKVVALLEKGYTTRLNDDEMYKVEFAQAVSRYRDTADIIRDNDRHLSKLVSKKAITTVYGASGYELTFKREFGGGYDSETIKHVILKKGNTYFEVVVSAPSKEWSSIETSVDASIQTSRI